MNQHHTGPSPSRLFWVDWARFLSALAVVFSHAVPGTLSDWNSLADSERGIGSLLLYAAGAFGQEAVIVFFVLSGYLVGGKVYERLRAGNFDLPKYAIDRLTRIYVPLVPIAMLSAVIWVGLGHAVDPWQLLLNLCQMQGVLCESFAANKVFWTLAYEVWFYVLGGAIGAMLTLRGAGRVLGAVVALGVLALFARLEPTYLLCWLLGAAACALSSRRVPGWAASGAVLLLIGSLLALSPYGLPGKNTAAHHLAFLSMSAACGLLVSALAQRPPSGWLATVESAGTRFADSSYTLYLSHAPVMALLAAAHPMSGLMPGWLAASVILGKVAACLVLAWLLYLLFESRTAAARAWLSARLRIAR